MFKTSSGNIPLEGMSLRKPVSESFLAPVNVGRRSLHRDRLCEEALHKENNKKKSIKSTEVVPDLMFTERRSLFDNEWLPHLPNLSLMARIGFKGGGEAPAVCSEGEPTRKTTAFTSY